MRKFLQYWTLIRTAVSMWQAMGWQNPAKPNEDKAAAVLSILGSAWPKIADDFPDLLRWPKEQVFKVAAHAINLAVAIRNLFHIWPDEEESAVVVAALVPA